MDACYLNKQPTVLSLLHGVTSALFPVYHYLFVVVVLIDTVGHAGVILLPP